MRVLATVLPGLGHLNPMVPLLRELADRGHDVEVVVPPPFVPYVERVGLRATGLGPEWTESQIEDVHPGWLSLDGPAQLRVWTEFATRFVPFLAPHVEARRPDVIIHDHYEMAGWLVGERLGIPNVPYGMTVRGLDPVLIALCEANEAFDRMREAVGLEPEGADCSGGRWLYLDALMPSLTSALMPPGSTVHHVRHVADDRSGGDRALPLVVLQRDRPLVYVTLGTVFNRAESVMARLIEGAAQVDAEVLVTVGEHGELPDRVPGNVTVERYVPQAELYGHLAAVVCHGGFGTVFGALSHGLPVASAPIAADQTVNAALVAGAGAGINLATALPPGGVFPVLQPGEPAPDDVAAAVDRLLNEQSLREAAGVLADEMDRGATPEGAATLVEQVVARGAPVERAPS